MLSILIPTYNYNILPLAAEIHRQCAQCAIPFEVIALDDGSHSSQNIHNQKINSLSSSFAELPQNIGRSAIRNLLANKAKYGWLLFLDADTMPEDVNFISNYIEKINDDEKVVYGGIRYQKERPADNEVLRWVYGNDREAPEPDARKKAPYISLLTLNFLIAKSIFDRVRFNEQIPNLRHEDTLFSYNLSQAGIKVEHIQNRVIHHGLESSETFMRKSEESLTGLKLLLDDRLIAPDYTSIGRIYTLLKKARMAGFVAFAFRLIRKPVRKSLTGSRPSLLMFDIYRLGYLCNIK